MADTNTNKKINNTQKNNEKTQKNNQKNNEKTQKNNKTKNTKKKGIKMVLWNKGPAKLCNRIPNIDHIINEHSPHILIINEANVNKEELKKIKFQGYKIETDQLITETQQARTIMIIHEDINYQRCPSLEKPHLSTIWIKAGLSQQRKIMVNGHYRQWRLLQDNTGNSHKVSEQRTRLKQLIEPWITLSNTGMETIAMGDINLPNSDNHQTTLYDKKLLPLIDEYNTTMTNSLMTRMDTQTTRQMKGQLDSSPDQIHLTHPSKMSQVSVHQQGDSDHQLLTITRTTNKPILKPRYRVTRNYENLDINEFNVSLLTDHRYLAAVIDTDPNRATEHLQTLLQDKLNAVAPEIVIQLSKKTQHKLSQETRNMIKERDMIRISAKLTDDQGEWRKYRNLRNTINSQMKKEYADQDRKALNPEKNTPAELWKAAKNLSGTETKTTPRRLLYQGTHHDCPQKIADILNTQYIDRANKIIQSIPHTTIDPMHNYKKMLRGKHLHMSLRTITMGELKRTLRSMKPTKSSSDDGLTMRLILNSTKVLAKPLLNIINSSISTNTFPDSLKTSKIVPILKNSKDPSIPENYRPVNMLPPISKIIEKVIMYQLTEHIEKNNLIPGNHNGSRPKHSTTTTTMTLHDMWSSILEDDMDAVVLQLDQSAAYDIIAHDIMQNKLEALGLDKHSLSWFKSYMSDRRQTVHVESKRSQVLPTGPRSVVQGSVLSCLMYLLYILDMPMIYHESQHTTLADSHCGRTTASTYVDDVNNTIKCAKNSPDLLNKKLHENLAKTKSYFDANKLAMNCGKTKIFVVSRHPDRQKQIKLRTEDKIILHNKTINVLGILVNDKLTWHDHVIRGPKSLLSQIKQRITSLYHLVKHTGRKFAIQLANGMIMSKIEYAIALWGTSPQYVIDIIQRQLNRAARAVLGPTTQRWSVYRLMTAMGWLRLNDLIKYHQSCLIHQLVFTGSPQYLHDKIVCPDPGKTRTHKNRKIGTKPHDRGKSMYTKNNLSSSAYQVYNTLPGIITSIPVRSIFKRRLRRYFINKDDVPSDTDKVFGHYLRLAQTDKPRKVSPGDLLRCPDTPVTNYLTFIPDHLPSSASNFSNNPASSPVQPPATTPTSSPDTISRPARTSPDSTHTVSNIPLSQSISPAVSVTAEGTDSLPAISVITDNIYIPSV